MPLVYQSFYFVRVTIMWSMMYYRVNTIKIKTGRNSILYNFIFL